jgi:hypothetical protein
MFRRKVLPPSSEYPSVTFISSRIGVYSSFPCPQTQRNYWWAPFRWEWEHWNSLTWSWRPEADQPIKYLVWNRCLIHSSMRRSHWPCCACQAWPLWLYGQGRMLVPGMDWQSKLIDRSRTWYKWQLPSKLLYIQYRHVYPESMIKINLRFSQRWLWRLYCPLDVTPCSPIEVHQGFRVIYCPSLLFDPENGGNMFLRNVGWLSADYTTLNHRRWNTSLSLLSRIV